MTHVMIAAGSLDHAFRTCPAFMRSVAANLDAKIFIDAEAEWNLDIDHPWEMRPFGLCGWCWRKYISKRPLTKALIKYGAWEIEPEQTMLFDYTMGIHGGNEAPAYWYGRMVSP